LLNVAEKRVAVPYTDLRVWSDDESLAIPLTRAETEAARSFAGEDPRVADGIAENKKAYEDEPAQRDGDR
jgi:hypothetical protein